MTVTITGTGPDRTLTFTKTAPSAKMLDTAVKAAEYLWNQGYGNHGTPEQPRTFADTTNSERLAILDKYITDGLKAAALSQHINSAVSIARTDAEKTGDFEL